MIVDRHVSPFVQDLEEEPTGPLCPQGASLWIFEQVEDEGINRYTLAAAKRELKISSTKNPEGQGNWQKGLISWVLPKPTPGN
jgi:hypothetical protein